jgi:hypothetical protein
MRLLSALFLLPQNGGNRKCQTCLVRSLSAGQCSGDWGMPTNKRSPFCTKGHCLPILSRIRVNTVTDVVEKQPSGCTVIQI